MTIGTIFYSFMIWAEVYFIHNNNTLCLYILCSYYWALPIVFFCRSYIYTAVFNILLFFYEVIL